MVKFKHTLSYRQSVVGRVRHKPTSQRLQSQVSTSKREYKTTISRRNWKKQEKKRVRDAHTYIYVPTCGTNRRVLEQWHRE